MWHTRERAHCHENHDCRQKSLPVVTGDNMTTKKKKKTDVLLLDAKKFVAILVIAKKQLFKTQVACTSINRSWVLVIIIYIVIEKKVLEKILEFCHKTTYRSPGAAGKFLQ